MDVAGEPLLYDKSMTRVYLADSQPEERSALRLLLLDLNMEVVGEAVDWSSTLAKAPATNLEMLLVDWDLLPVDLGYSPWLNCAWPVHTPLSLFSSAIWMPAARPPFPPEQMHLSVKVRHLERVAERLRTVAASVGA